MSINSISAESSYSNMNPLTMKMSRDDINLPLIYPVTGKLPERKFNSLIDLICNKIFPFSPHIENPTYAQIVRGFTGDANLPPIDHIRKKMSREKLAVIRKKSTGSLLVDLSKRVCQRHTFGSDVVSDISDIIIDFIKPYISRETNIRISDIKIDPVHGDILYYEEGGVFDLHVDGVNKCPFENNKVDEFGFASWRMYTLLIGLDSNLSPINLSRGDGNTVIYLPEQTFLQHICRLGNLNSNTLYNLLSEYHVNKNRHSYIDSCQKGRFLLFSSEALHASNKIMQQRGFKMAMKLDVWIRTDNDYNYLKILSPEKLLSLGKLSDGSIHSTPEYIAKSLKDKNYLYHNILINPHKCKCHDCSEYLLKLDVYHKNITKIFMKTKLNSDACMLISEFIVGTSIKERCNTKFFSGGNCSCHNCVPWHSIDDYDDYYDDDDDYDCNGYCDDY